MYEKVNGWPWCRILEQTQGKREPLGHAFRKSDPGVTTEEDAVYKTHTAEGTAVMVV